MKRQVYLILFMMMVGMISQAFSPLNDQIIANDDNITVVSWYGGKFHGRLTASGEVYNMNDLTAANKKLAFGTKVKINNLNNGKSVVVRINDRGPYVGNRKFDLSKAAFSKIADINKGVVKVSYEILD